MVEIDKTRLIDINGRPLTQSLFLEIGYSDYAVYTLKENNHTWNDKYYPSMKLLYLETADPTEYEFANKYLLNWSQWKRLLDNKVTRAHINEWREELEVKLRCQGVKYALTSAKLGSFQAAKWIADRGWDSRGAGRPSKAEVEREKQFQATIDKEYSADIVRLIGSK